MLRNTDWWTTLAALISFQLQVLSSFLTFWLKKTQGLIPFPFLTGSISKPAKEFPIESYYSPNIHLEIFVLNMHVVFIFFILFWGVFFGTEMMLQLGCCRFRFF